ncbi:MAG TPA: hypothetical protein PLJ24_10610 [Anaerolineae bacterium]|nr:hypothetical protein [Anaerolineae bacterium]
MDEIVAGAILESLTSKALDIAWSRLRKKMDIGLSKQVRSVWGHRAGKVGLMRRSVV